MGRQLLVTSDGVWLATDQGAVHVSRAGDRVDRYGATNGLGDGRALSLALYRGRVVVGTMRGLSESHGDSGFVSLAPGFADPVYSLRANGDTLWIGTVRGLFALLPGSDEPRMSDGFRLLAGSSAAILAIGYIADTLVAMTPSQLLWRDPRSGGWTVGPDLGSRVGSLVALEPTDNGAWVGGTNGAAFVRGNGTVLQLMLVPGDLPGEVTSVATRGRYLWIGTRAGLVRFLLTN